MPLNIIDSLRNPGVVDNYLNGHPVNNTVYTWSSPDNAFIGYAAEPKRVRNILMGERTANIGILTVAEKNYMIQAPVIIDGNDNALYGVGVVLASMTLVRAMVYKVAGVYYAKLNNGAAIVIPAQTPHNSYCVRMISRADTNVLELWVATIDENLNPNLSFTKLDSQAGGFGTVSPGLYSADANNTGGFQSIFFSDGSNPFPFRVFSWDNFLDAPIDSKLAPYGAGWLLSNTYDFSLSGAYSLRLPDEASYFRVRFSQVEFNNLANAESVSVQFGARRFTVPAGRVVVTDVSPNDYPYFTMKSGGGSMRVNAYAGASINYSVIN